MSVWLFQYRIQTLLQKQVPALDSVPTVACRWVGTECFYPTDVAAICSIVKIKTGHFVEADNYIKGDVGLEFYLQFELWREIARFWA